MNWSRVSQWAEISDCERYTVCVAKVLNRYVFTAWRRATTKTLAPTELGCFDDIALAKDAAQKDADEHYARGDR